MQHVPGSDAITDMVTTFDNHPFGALVLIVLVVLLIVWKNKK
jgi:hypothetical protein